SCRRTAEYATRWHGWARAPRRRNAGGPGARTPSTISGRHSNNRHSHHKHPPQLLVHHKHPLPLIVNDIVNSSITSTAGGYDIITTPFLPADPTSPTVYDIVDSPVGRLLLTGAAPADDVRPLTALYLP